MPIIVKDNEVNVLTLMHGSAEMLLNVDPKLYRYAAIYPYIEVTRFAMNKQEFGYLYCDGSSDGLEFKFIMYKGIDPKIFVPDEEDVFSIEESLTVDTANGMGYSAYVFECLGKELAAGHKDPTNILGVMLSSVRFLYPKSRFSTYRQYLTHFMEG